MICYNSVLHIIILDVIFSKIYVILINLSFQVVDIVPEAGS